MNLVLDELINYYIYCFNQDKIMISLLMIRQEKDHKWNQINELFNKF